MSQHNDAVLLNQRQRSVYNTSSRRAGVQPPNSVFPTSFFSARVRPANPPVGGNAAKITENTELPGDSDPGADVDRLVSAGHPEGSNEKLICKS